MIVIGLTGGLATGKSTVAAMFADLGAGTINADLVAHHGLRPGGACFKKVLKTFGKQILRDGQIDRKALAQIVFRPKPASRTLLKKLEGIIHPFVIRETKKQIRAFQKAGRKIVVLDVPLLFESGMDRLAELTLVVKASAQIQKARALKRGRISFQEARQRMRYQLPLSEKIRRADLVVDNGGPIKVTRKRVKEIWNMLNRRYQ